MAGGSHVLGVRSQMKVKEKQRKDILFLCQYFYPEHNSSATLPFDTAKYLASHGFLVDGMVGYPKEYSDDKNLPLEEVKDGVGIRRIRYIQMNRAKRLGRLVNYFSFTFSAWLRRSYLRNYKAVIVYSNPPVLPVIPLSVKRRYGTKIVYVAYDVYPEVAYASKSLTPGSLISRVMNRINTRLFSQVDCVVALTDEMKEFLLARRPDLTRDRVVTIANWAHEGVSLPGESMRDRFGSREDQFVVSYFGNMGICQDVETMLDAARLLKDDDRISFLIAGHGNKTDRVESRIRTEGLENVKLFGFLTGEEFQQAVAISSCFIVSLERGLMGTCAPSKYYSYLQGGRPVLVVAEKDSYLIEETEKERIGYGIELGDAEALRDAVISMAENPEACAEMGRRAKILYDEHYSYGKAMEKYASVMAGICGNARESVNEITQRICGN